MISSVSIEYFRAFAEKQTIELASPDGRQAGSGLTIIVGPNGAGKTTFVDVMRLIFGNVEHIDLPHRHEGRAVCFCATRANDGKTCTLNTTEGSPIYRDLGWQDQKLKWIPSRREWSRRTSVNSMNEDTYRAQLASQTERVFTDSWFIGRCAQLVKDGQQHAFNEMLKAVLPELQSWSIDRDRGETSIYYKTAFGTNRTADLFSDGVGSIFRIVLSIFTAEEDELIIIDEPELSLHPQAQKRLASLIGAASSTRQVIVTTHSTYFVNWPFLFSGAKVYRFHLPTACGISVKALSPKTLKRLKGIARDWQKPQQLDEVAKEVFFADHIVLVEGQEDVGLLTRFIDENGLLPLDFFGYGAGGAGNVPLFMQMAKEIGITASALFDGDKKGDAEATQKLFPEFNIVILPTDDIRDKKARDIAPKTGLFDDSGKVKTNCAAEINTIIAKLR